MIFGGKPHVFALLAGLFLLVLGPAHAETACADMPCCSTEKVASTSADPSPGYACGECRPQTCTCSISPREPRQKVGSVHGLSLSLELEPNEVHSRRPVRPTPETDPTDVAGYASSDGFQRNEKFVFFSAFPNPPPAL